MASQKEITNSILKAIDAQTTRLEQNPFGGKEKAAAIRKARQALSENYGSLSSAIQNENHAIYKALNRPRSKITPYTKRTKRKYFDESGVKTESLLAVQAELFRHDKEKVLKKVTSDGLALQYASDELKADLEVVRAAVEQNGMALKYADKELRNNLSIVMAAVKENELALAFADEELKKDETLVFKALKPQGKARIIHVPHKNHKKEVADARLFALQFVSPELRDKREFKIKFISLYRENKGGYESRRRPKFFRKYLQACQQDRELAFLLKSSSEQAEQEKKRSLKIHHAIGLLDSNPDKQFANAIKKELQRLASEKSSRVKAETIAEAITNNMDLKASILNTESPLYSALRTRRMFRKNQNKPRSLKAVERIFIISVINEFKDNNPFPVITKRHAIATQLIRLLRSKTELAHNKALALAIDVDGKDEKSLKESLEKQSSDLNKALQAPEHSPRFFSRTPMDEKTMTAVKEAGNPFDIYPSSSS